MEEVDSTVLESNIENRQAVGLRSANAKVSMVLARLCGLVFLLLTGKKCFMPLNFKEFLTSVSVLFFFCNDL